MTIDNISLGKRIRHARLKRKKSLVELGRQAGVSSVFISQIERGVSTGSLETLVAISNALEISIEDILIDSLQVTNTRTDDELSYALLGCSEEEADIILCNAENLRDILKEYDLKKRKKKAKVDNDMT